MKKKEYERKETIRRNNYSFEHLFFTRDKDGERNVRNVRKKPGITTGSYYLVERKILKLWWILADLRED